MENNLFNDIDGVDEGWKDIWKDMPEFISEDLEPFKSVIVHFNSVDDIKEFSKIVDQKINLTTKSIWFPKADAAIFANKRYIDEE